ncbi:MAG: FGGY family carbohydrate kinase [Candidatus Hadarchaeum sp.]|uniref:xylulokinase n=1 Tax=Candidatus Hadarchaeum sp. TaxID=2883567 RepID=UPI00317847F4
MHSKEVVLGVDIGTSALKAILCTLDGSIIAEVTQNYTPLRPKPGWVEHNPEEWWHALCAAALEARHILDAHNLELIAVGLTHQRMTFIPVDPAGKPLSNAILWNDTRCVAETRWVEEKLGKSTVFKATGCPPGMWSVYKILWIKRNNPLLYEKTWKFVLVNDFVNYRLTNNWVTTQSAAILTGALDVEHLTWHADFLKELGLSVEKMVDSIVPGCVLAGRVTKAAAEVTHLPEGTPVFTAAGDQPCGSLAAGMTKPGVVAINGGSSCTIEMLCDALPERTTPDYFIEIFPDGRYIIENSIYTGSGTLLSWFKDKWWNITQLPRKEKNMWTTIFDTLEKIPPGSSGMLLVPFLSGAGAPFWDLEAKGALIGLSLHHSVHELGRAILEGIAYEVRRSIESFQRATNNVVQKMLLYGGSSRSSLWNQILSDVTGLPAAVPTTPETTALGAAICAAVGCGAYEDLCTAVETMVHYATNIETNAENYRIYEKLYTIYYDVYELLKHKFKAIDEFVRD